MFFCGLLFKNVFVLFVMQADTNNEWQYDYASAGDSQVLVFISPKQSKIEPKSAGNSQDCLRLDAGVEIGQLPI